MFDLEEAKMKTVNIANEAVQKAITKEAAALSLQQKKLLFYMISTLSENDKEFKFITISITDFIRLTGIGDSGKSRNLLRKEIESFATKYFWIREGDKDRLYRWVDQAEIDYKKGQISLKLHDTVKGFLLGLSERSRAIFQLGYALQFKHKYSPELYAFAASIKDFMLYKKTMYKIKIEDAYERFGNNKYRDSAQWKRKVLDPAVKEINEKTDLYLYVEFVKMDKTKPRKVTHVLFGVTKKVGEELDRVRINALCPDMLDEQAKILAEETTKLYAFEELGFKEDVLSEVGLDEIRKRQESMIDNEKLVKYYDEDQMCYWKEDINDEN